MTCSIMVVILSANSNISTHVQKEVERAVSTGKKVVPFRIEDVLLSKSLEYFLSSAQWFNAYDLPFDTHIDKLITALFKDLAGRMIGRGRELTFAEDVIKGAKNSNGSLLLISGEAGIGKSYLMEAIVSLAKSSNFRVFTTTAQPFETLQPYGLWQQLIFKFASIPLDTPIVKAESTLINHLSTFPDLKMHISAICAICGFKVEEFGYFPDEVRTRNALLALKVYLHLLQELQPILLSFDDLHWADSCSIEMLDRLGESLTGMRMLVCCTARPEFKHTWAQRSFYQQVTLRRLNDDESLAMIHELAAEKALTPEQEKMIVERGEGNPFYLSEMVRMAAETGLSELPITIEEIIIQRIDQLAEKERQVIETAAVIGREFSEKVLNSIPNMEQIESNVEQLRRQEIIYEKHIVPEIQYIFRHYFTHKATYNNITIEKRKALHKQVAETIESIYKDNLERHYAILAQHYEQGGDYQKAFDCYRLAGEMVQQTQSDGAAVALLQKGEEAMEALYKEKEQASLPSKVFGILMPLLISLVVIIGAVKIIGKKGLNLQSIIFILIGCLPISLFSYIGYLLHKSSNILLYPDKIVVIGDLHPIEIPFKNIISFKNIIICNAYDEFIHEIFCSCITIGGKTRKFPYQLVTVTTNNFILRKGYNFILPSSSTLYTVLNNIFNRYQTISNTINI